ncbi:hypothetical protein HYH03_013521 [Edaphochlamys debaryana]|uniref:Uncharacterized protein n=1 Tax=Edaphochlamys debaryana TaxID=47281 RepID=A0A835XQY4_9CHLO|nr:hypothetical protein HYH03_013521 [Edaphochlamys debaryana]|eukprot:KAG2487942.1 hypothetical protein HYH03_013521 [Edaphochlamys debaryana]
MSLQRRVSSGPRSGSGDGAVSLTRNNSFSGLTEDLIKSATQRFDLEIVFKLTWTHKGLAKLGGLERCTSLVELNLTGNQITRIEGLESCVALRRLVLSCNRISRVEGLGGLTKLEGLWLQGNQIPSLEALALPHLAELPALSALYLQNIDRSMANGVCRAAGYKGAVLAALAGLSNLDGERYPHSINYAELAAEYDAFRANPTPPKEWVVPEVRAWLAGVDMELPAGGAGGEAELQLKHTKIVKALDECEMLTHVLREETAKFARAQQERQAAEG